MKSRIVADARTPLIVLASTLSIRNTLKNLSERYFHRVFVWAATFRPSLAQKVRSTEVILIASANAKSYLCAMKNESLLF